MPVYKIKKPDKEDAEKTFIGNCAGKIIFLSMREFHLVDTLPAGYCQPSNKSRTLRRAVTIKSYGFCLSDHCESNLALLNLYNLSLLSNHSFFNPVVVEYLGS